MQLRTTFHFKSELIRSCTRSRLGWLVACFHMAWFLLAIANMSPPSPAFADFLDHGGWSSATLFAGRPFHFTYESLPLKILILADMPSAFVGACLGLLASPLLQTIRLSVYAASYRAAALLLVISTGQWLLIGYLLQTHMELLTWGKAWLEKLDRHFALTMAIILLFTVVFVPILDQRSHMLGFRHPAVSFR